jgi:hypothetical protein
LEQKRKSFFAKLTFWEKVYYAAGALGGGYFLYTRLDLDGSKAAAAAVRWGGHGATACWSCMYECYCMPALMLGCSDRHSAF